MPYVWLGNEERGLAWCAESDQGWQLNEPSKAIRIETRDNTVHCKIYMLDHETQIQKPIVIRFGLTLPCHAAHA